MFTRIREWLTPERRLVIYKAVVGIGIALVGLGIITPEMLDRVDRGVAIVAGIVLAVTNLLAKINVPTGD